MYPNYKKLEIAANLGDVSARQAMEERRSKLVKLPIRDALGYSLTWCPEDIPQQKMSAINQMYDMIHIIENNIFF